MDPAQETISGSVVYGTQQNCFPNGIMSDQDIANVWAYFYTGLTASSINGQQCVNHSGDVIMTAVSASNSTGNYEPTNYTSGGQKWVQMIESIYNPAPSAVPLEGGMDIEEGTAYLGPSPTEAMATGFNEDDTSPYYILWDFGSDNGGTSPGNGWTANDVYALATGLPAGGLYFEWDGPLPEIYSINYDGMADDWMSLSCYEIGQGNSAAAFPGLTSDGSPTTSWYYLYADTSNTNDGYGETNDKTCSAETNGGSTLNYLSTF
jgi:hypothetical protein